MNGRGWGISSLAGWVVHNILPGLGVTAALLLVLAAAGEVYLRATRPFVEPRWASKFDPVMGFIFEPGARIRHTNHIDYWTEQVANSWGFLDDEPPAPGPHETCRVVFVGDSFVEAAQVPIERKFHRLLQTQWNRIRGNPKLDTLALGYSGTGQANQLPWAGLVEPLAPNLIVLVFVSNDFANNNRWLEAARNGWHPDHPPRPFVDDGQLRQPDPDWRRHLLPGQTGSAQAAWSVDSGGLVGWLHRRLYQKSYLYTSLNRIWVHYAYGAPAYYANTPSALAELRKLPGGKEKFGDWQPPHDLTLDQMFMAERMPPVFEEALRDNQQALALWQRRASAMGASIVILATHTLKAKGLPPDAGAARARHVRPGLMFERLLRIAESLGIPVIDQAAYIEQEGGDIQRASFPFDGHWSEYGHRMAAGAMSEWLRAHPEVCTRG